jgi:hypothetical protein
MRHRSGRPLRFPKPAHMRTLGVIAIYECIECGGPRDVEMSRPGPNYAHKDWCPVLISERNAVARDARQREQGWIAGS